MSINIDMKKTIKAVDLFCGAGGTSSGLAQACKVLGYDLKLIAINHWDIAIATHSTNNPGFIHMCEELDDVNPRKAVPEGYLDLLVASPECTHHSLARGGRPMSDQSRASGWHILRWAEALQIENILIENVKEFRSWGPIGINGRPLKSKRGETFNAFINALRALNYTVDYKILNAANYGDPTTRERLFIMARRGKKKIIWPEPTHTPTGEKTLFGMTKPWRTAREIIDWNIEGSSIFDRKRPLAENTIKRIVAGLRKYCGKQIEPFLVMLYNTNKFRSINRPMPTVTGGGQHIGLCEPFLVVMKGNSKTKEVNKPVPAITTKQYVGLCEPFLVEFYGNGGSHSIKKPVPTVTTKDRFGVCQSFIVGIGQTGANSNRVRSVDKPLPTFVTKNEFALCQPFIIPNFGERNGQKPRTHSIDKPLPSVTGHGAGALVEPFIIGQQSCSAPRSTNKPLPTISTAGAIALVQPEIQGQKLDVKFRMLRPHELARAMSFDDNYKFSGNQQEQVKQIGNAVPVMIAQKLCEALLQ